MSEIVSVVSLCGDDALHTGEGSGAVSKTIISIGRGNVALGRCFHSVKAVIGVANNTVACCNSGYIAVEVTKNQRAENLPAEIIYSV